jgi:hypothetical protein
MYEMQENLLSLSIAVRIRYHFYKTGLISWGFWIYIRLFQIQVHRGDAEDAERGWYFWRIGERPILQKLTCGHKHA